MHLTANVQCPVHNSFRVQQVAGMFDVLLAEKCRERFSVELPDEDEPWQIGAIVGPSGSGKSTIAAQAYGEALYTGSAWPADRAVIDGFGGCSIRRITRVLTSVGFSSPPAWIKPYHILSAGERFRCDLAAALLSDRPLVVFDEFTSIVDRTVAKIGSAAIAKAIRRARRRFVAVTCHDDVVPWLGADWVLDLASGTLHRRRLRRPEIVVKIFRCRHEAWRLFAKHHYLTGALNKAARCYLATWADEPVAFCALLPSIGHRGIWRISRLVVLPDYQGIGVGSRLAEAIGELNHTAGLRTTITTSHPAMIRYLYTSPRWHIRRLSSGGRRFSRTFAHRKSIHATSTGRTVVSAEYFEVR